MLALVASTASADLLGLKDIKADGSLEVLGVSANNEEDFSPANDHRGNTVTRVRIGVDADVTEGVTARIEAVRTPSTSIEPSLGTRTNQFGDGGRPSSPQNETDNFKFQNTYLELAGFLSLDKVRLGRQYMGRENDAIVYFGPLRDDALNVTAVDALSVWKKIGPVNVWAVTGKTQEDDNIPGATGATDAGDIAGAGDTNGSWITASSDELIKLDGISVPLELGYYAVTNSSSSASSDNVNLSIIDLRAGVRAMDDMVSASLEYAMNGGQANTGATKVDFKGSLLLLKAGVECKEKSFGAHVELANASGDDTTGNSEDKSFHDVSGDYRYGEILTNDSVFTAANGLGAGLDTGNEGPGLNIVKIGGYYRLPVCDKKLTAHAAYIMAKTSKAVAPGIGKKIGNEIDVALKYAHSDTVSAKIGYAMLTPDDVLTGGGAAPDDDVTKMFAKLMVKWGQPEMMK